MTPIKYILVVGMLICTVDHSEHREIQADAPSAEKAQWVAWSLGRAHKVPVMVEIDSSNHALRVDITKEGSVERVEQLRLERRNAYKKFVAHGGNLFEAEPDCEHELIDAVGGGVRCCVKCPGWYCE